MKEMIKIAAFVLFTLSGITSFSQSETPEQLTVPLSSPGKPYTMKVSLITGSIKVIGYSGKDIMIDVTTSPRNKNPKFAFRFGEVSIASSGKQSRNVPDGMKRISTPGGYDVTAKESNNVVTVSAGDQNQALNLNLTLKIPQDVKLKLSMINGGAIEAEDVKGELEIDNVNGPIALKNISGSVVANSVNGNVTTSFLSVDPKAAMAFSTLNGNISVTFPADTKSNLKIKSEMGEIFSDFDVDIDKTQPKVEKTSGNGMYRLNREDGLSGKINGGGPEMMMKTMNGSIYIRKAK